MYAQVFGLSICMHDGLLWTVIIKNEKSVSKHNTGINGRTTISECKLKLKQPKTL